jgi:hypothetical protein
MQSKSQEAGLTAYKRFILPMECRYRLNSALMNSLGTDVERMIIELLSMYGQTAHILNKSSSRDLLTICANQR